MWKQVTPLAIVSFPSRVLILVVVAVSAEPEGVRAQVAFPPAAQIIIGQAGVVDGDTIEIHGTRIRLHGIDAPESGQTCEALGERYRCGQRAAIALDGFLGSQTVKSVQTDTDRWKRIVARCFIRGNDLGKWMVENGWAIAFRRYSTEYVESEARARDNKLGMWKGEFMPPEEWRRGGR